MDWYGGKERALRHLRGARRCVAVLGLRLEGRTTLDVDVLPSSRFLDAVLRRSCAAAGVDFNPTSGKDLAEVR
ncbi:MAG: hypothetical protein PHQ91_06915 [Thermoanaerobaculaceae bacterium]|nr:hypothetical protein [Thermoanaerobaculaceae bacterium]